MQPYSALLPGAITCAAFQSRCAAHPALDERHDAAINERREVVHDKLAWMDSMPAMNDASFDPKQIE